MNLQIIQVLGGGDSWFYLYDGCKALDSCHKDDVIGMQRLRDKKKQLEDEQKQNFANAIKQIKTTPEIPNK